MNIREMDSAYIAHTYGRANLLAQTGSGATVYDETGKKYIDLGSGIGVNCFEAALPEELKDIATYLENPQKEFSRNYLLLKISFLVPPFKQRLNGYSGSLFFGV